MNGFRDLRVWQGGMELVKAVYVLTRSFPKNETYGLASQVQRAAVSVPSNIAEGHTRQHLREYLNQLSIAQGSLAELETQIEIAAELGYITENQLKESIGVASSLAKQIFMLRSSLAKKLPSPKT